MMMRLLLLNADGAASSQASLISRQLGVGRPRHGLDHSLLTVAVLAAPGTKVREFVINK